MNSAMRDRLFSKFVLNYILSINTYTGLVDTVFNKLI